ncbi:PaaI family thioesterase [Vibrio sp. T187]|uniref:PaaI family thioesterase n=1 Tax=Vibrio TaxID=662 RepID=UPI0010C9DBCD|nr:MULTISPECIES: hotdog domain-containing protein [Vibrio]MBW3698433.1 PaaI family thioesterase [Vibrio sp. T187]
MTIPHMFQDSIPHNHCYGCGPNNEHGLQIKSHWEQDDVSVCIFHPSPHHSAGPTHYLNGGIISTIIDCHCVCTAIAKGYQMAGRDIGCGESIWFATGQLNVSFKQPVAIDQAVLLRARVTEAKENKITLSCQLMSEGKICVESELVAVKVPSSWFDE